MRHTLHSHIIYLENSIQSFRDRLTGPRLAPDEVKEIERQLYHAELALARYREAYELEISVSSPEPSDNPGAKSGNGGGAHEATKPGKKKEGLVACAVRARRKARVRRLPGFAACGANELAAPWCIADAA